MVRPLLLFATLMLSLAGPVLAQEFKAGQIVASTPLASPSMPGARALAAYVSLENRGAAADRLLRASTPVAESVEIHTMKMEGDVMRMRELGPFALKAGQTVRMGRASPDGLHLMLMTPKQTLKEGDTFPMSLEFERAGRLELTVTVSKDARGAASTQAGGGHMHGHKH